MDVFCEMKIGQLNSSHSTATTVSSVAGRHWETNFDQISSFSHYSWPVLLLFAWFLFLLFPFVSPTHFHSSTPYFAPFCLVSFSSPPFCILYSFPLRTKQQRKNDKEKTLHENKQIKMEIRTDISSETPMDLHWDNCPSRGAQGGQEMD